MFLKNIRIENLRCLVDAEVSFETEDGKVRKWTILVGDNGTGKSTVLQAVALLMAGSEGLMDLLHDPDKWVRNGAESCRISGVLTAARGQERTIALTLRRGQSKRQLLHENAESLKRLDDALEHTNRSYPTIGYGGSRHSSESSYGGIDAQLFHHFRAQASATLFADHAQMIPVELWLMHLHSRRASAGLKIMRHALEGLLPNVTFDKFDRDRHTLMFKTPEGLVPLGQLGAGYRSVIGFCGDLLYRITKISDDYNRPLEARGLLLIDELGLHLHPVWQRTLVDFLTNKLPNFQLIVTTNSPLTAHQAGEGELYYLRREEPSGPPVLHHFEGAPNKLLLHQLILSPVFGVETANSHRVQCDRREFRKLRSKSSKTRKDKRRIKVLKKNLSEVTEWGEITKHDRKRSALLDRIKQRLSDS
ncbi:MAG: AAA family ATPase [Deltaproteobacteria bacterium]|nr:MAG: AAA family ATPase [Deltaproteobacteria bacterium]